MREKQDQVVNWASLDRELLALISLPFENQNPDREHHLRRSKQEIEQHIGAIELQLQREFPDFAALSSPKALSVVETQKLLAADEAILVYLITDRSVLTWA